MEMPAQKKIVGCRLLEAWPTEQAAACRQSGPFVRVGAP